MLNKQGCVLPSFCHLTGGDDWWIWSCLGPRRQDNHQGMAEQGEEGAWVAGDLSGAEITVQRSCQKEWNFYAYTNNTRGVLSPTPKFVEQNSIPGGTTLPWLKPKMDVLGLEETFWWWVAKTQILAAGKLAVLASCQQSIQGHDHLEYVGRQNTELSPTFKERVRKLRILVHPGCSLTHKR